MKKLLIVSLAITFLLALVPMASAQGATKVACTEDYTVQANDWLSKLSDKYFNDVLAYWAIQDATNAAGAPYATIKDPNVIEIGWKLCVPSKDDAVKLLAAKGLKLGATAAPAAAAGGKAYKIALVPKGAGNPYFDAVHKGADEAAKELGDTMIFQAPATADAAGQIEIVNALIAQKPDVIGVSANDGDALAPAGKKAMDAGVKVISWDSAIAPSGRILNENQANSELVGRAQVQMMYDMIGGAGDVAILSAGATMTNQNTWIKWMQEELKDPKYKDINLVATVYGDDDRQKSINEAQGLFKTYPNLKGIISPTSVGIAAAAKALQDAGLCGKVQLTGLGLPSELRDYVKNDCIKAFGLWNPIDQGYLTTYISHRLAAGEIKGVAGETFRAGRMGEYKIVDTGNGDLQVYQGPPFKFDKTNIDSPAASF